MSDDWDDHYMSGTVVLLTDGTRAKVLGLMAAVDHSFDVDKYLIDQAGARRYVEATEITGRAPKHWHCEAYGVQSMTEWCYFQEGPDCATEQICATNMTAERKRIYNKLVDDAADGDENSRWLITQIKGPDEILNGPNAPGR